MLNHGTKLPIKTRNAIKKRLVDFPPSAARAQLKNIADYRLVDGESIAERFMRDHQSNQHAHRAASLLVDAGAATTGDVYKRVHCGNGEYKDKHTHTTIIFEDGSTLP